MTGEQIFGIAALALLGPLTATLWYFDKRRSGHKRQSDTELQEKSEISVG